MIKPSVGTLMIWDCMTVKTYRVHDQDWGKHEDQPVLSDLRDKLIDLRHFYALDQVDIIFQQDNDPNHTSNMIRA